MIARFCRGMTRSDLGCYQGFTTRRPSPIKDFTVLSTTVKMKCAIVIGFIGSKYQGLFIVAKCSSHTYIHTHLILPLNTHTHAKACNSSTLRNILIQQPTCPTKRLKGCCATRCLNAMLFYLRTTWSLRSYHGAVVPALTKVKQKRSCRVF